MSEPGLTELEVEEGGGANIRNSIFSLASMCIYVLIYIMYEYIYGLTSMPSDNAL